MFAVKVHHGHFVRILNYVPPMRDDGTATFPQAVAKQGLLKERNPLWDDGPSLEPGCIPFSFRHNQLFDNPEGDME